MHLDVYLVISVHYVLFITWEGTESIHGRETPVTLCLVSLKIQGSYGGFWCLSETVLRSVVLVHYTAQHRLRHTAQRLKNVVSAFASLHNEATVASSVRYFHLMAVGSILELAKLGSSKAAFTLLSH